MSCVVWSSDLVRGDLKSAILRCVGCYCSLQVAPSLRCVASKSQIPNLPPSKILENDLQLSRGVSSPLSGPPTRVGRALQCPALPRSAPPRVLRLSAKNSNSRRPPPASCFSPLLTTTTSSTSPLDFRGSHSGTGSAGRGTLPPSEWACEPGSSLLRGANAGLVRVP